jgi:hypothetical protein
MYLHRRWMHILTCAAGFAIFGAGVSAAPAIAMESVPFDSIAVLPTEVLDSLQCRLSFVGYRNITQEQFLLAVIDTATHWDAFEALQDVSLPYPPPHDPAVRFVIASQMARRLIDTLGTYAAVTNNTMPTSPQLAIAFVYTRHGLELGCEIILDRSEARDVYAALRATLEDDPAAFCYSAVAGHAGGVAVETNVTDVTAGVVSDLSAARRNPGSGQYAATLVIRNTSGTTLQGPIRAVLAVSTNATLQNADGRTCIATPVGLWHITVAETGLSSGASKSVVLFFANPSDSKIHIHVEKVVSGSGML